MEAAQNKALRKTIYCFLMFIVLRVIEELLVIPKAGMSTKSLIACLGGLVILFVYLYFDNKPLDSIGAMFSRHKIRKGFLIALGMNAVVAAAVFSAEIFQFKSYDGTSRLTLYYDDPTHSFSGGLKTFLLWSAFAVLVAVVHALFYELVFRGLLFSQASRAMSFHAANVMQAALYVVWFLVPAVRILMYALGEYGRKAFLTYIVFTVAYELLTAIKLGMLRKASGGIWICIFDHVMFSFILDMVHMQYTTPSMSVQTDTNYYVRLFAYQAISLLISIIYYQSKSKKIYTQQQIMALEKTSEADEI